MRNRALCLVTGGAGFIGSHVAERILEEGYRVRIFDNFSTGKKSNLTTFLSQVEVLKGDLRKESDVRKAVRGASYVFHVGAMRAVERSVDDPLETNDVNVTGTLRLLRASREAGVKRFIFSSSSSIYGNTRKFPSEENDRPDPESPYAASKIMGEYYCRNFWSLYGLETVSLRYFNVFGPRQDPKSKYANVVPLFIEALVRGRRPEIHWDGKQSRDFCYIDNVVLVNLLAMKTPGIGGEVFNVASRVEISILGLLNHLKKILGVRNVRPVFKPKRAGDVRRTFGDIRKAERILGYRVRVGFVEGLRRTSDWFLRYRHT